MSHGGSRSRETSGKQFLSNVLECLLGCLGINATGGKNPPTSSREGVAQMWASAVQKAVHKMEGRDVTSKVASVETQGLHVDYEEDFLQCRSSQVPRIFSDPKFLPSIATSVYELAIPSTTEEAAPLQAAPSRAAPEKSAPLGGPAGGPGGTSTPRMSLPPSPMGIMDDSDTDSVTTIACVDLDQSQPQESSTIYDRVLRNRHCRASGGSKNDAPPLKKITVRLVPGQTGGSSSTGLTDEVLHDQRFKVYEKDNETVHQVRMKILGLGDKMKPSQEDIDSSPIFALRRAADEPRALNIIGHHWIPHLEEKGHLADCPPKDFSYPDGSLPLYTRDGVLEHVSNLEHVLNKEKSSPLIAVVLPEVDFDFDKEFIITRVHKTECLNRISISLDTHSRKQIAFCPYCGVMNENTSTTHSHARKHLGLAFLCGGCYSKIYKRPQALFVHMQSCQPTVVHWKEKVSPSV